MFITSATTRLKEYVRIVCTTVYCVYYCRERWCWLFTSTVIFEGKVDCAENNAETFGGGVYISSKSLRLFVNTVIFTGNKVGFQVDQ